MTRPKRVLSLPFLAAWLLLLAAAAIVLPLLLQWVAELIVSQS